MLPVPLRFRAVCPFKPLPLVDFEAYLQHQQKSTPFLFEDVKASHFKFSVSVFWESPTNKDSAVFFLGGLRIFGRRF